MTANARPTIHLNGSSAAELLEAYRAAHAAMREALTALRATAPHGRDYYTQGPTAYDAASDEHRARLEAVRGVVVELEFLAAHVQQAQAQRSRAAR